jgi:hypothetical protein
MPIGTTDIAIGSIASELQYTPGDTQIKATLFQSSVLVYSVHGGSYHNYNNMGPSANASFKGAIEARYSLSDTLALSSWMHYNHDANARLNIRVTNNSTTDDVDVKLWMTPNQGAPSGFLLVSQVCARVNGSDIILTNYDTGYPAFGNFSSTGYWIYGEMNSLTSSGLPCMMSVVVSTDTDAAGGGQVRTNYTANGTPGGAWDLNTAPFAGDLVAGDNGSSFPSDSVSWNKRTTFEIVIT